METDAMLRKSCALVAMISAVCLASWSPAAEPKKPAAPGERLITPAELLERCRPTMLPLAWTVEKDEIITSDTDPTKKLRRIEVKFYSQELEGRRWGHPSVVYMPADPAVYNAPNRHGKVVIVGQRSWDGLTTGPWRGAYVGNYGEPMAAVTGYPTMICPVPGEYDGENGREISLRVLAQLDRKHYDIANNGTCRLAIPYLYAMDVMAGLLKIDKKDIRAVIGGHSKRVAAYTTAAMDPDRVVGVVYMGNESPWVKISQSKSPWRPTWPPYLQKWVKADVLYIGGTNEDGYRMFNINGMQELMNNRWTIEYVPNYRHASMSEKHFLDWRMWAAHCFEGRPITRITDLAYQEKGPDFTWGGRRYGAGGGTLFRCKIDTPNKIIQAKTWYVYCDDVPYWRDLVWYPEFMVPLPEGVWTGEDKQESREGYWAGYVTGKLPDAWLVEVKDIGGGYASYISSLPQDITHKPTAVRVSRGSRSRNWAPKQ